MGHSNALNSHFRNTEVVHTNLPDTLAPVPPTLAAELIISSFQCDATPKGPGSAVGVVFAATIRNIGDVTATIPATVEGGTISFSRLTRFPELGLLSISVWLTSRLNTNEGTVLEIEPGEEITRVFGLTPDSAGGTPFFNRQHNPYVVADLLADEDRPVVGATGQLDMDEFMELGNKVAMMPVIWR